MNVCSLRKTTYIKGILTHDELFESVSVTAAFNIIILTFAISHQFLVDSK